jgi:flavin reductase (DIM6/NTAB) family NADH-FMN oxidoreductase RutF
LTGHLWRISLQRTAIIISANNISSGIPAYSIIVHLNCSKYNALRTEKSINLQKKSAMINFEALFKISYGLYIVSAGNKDRGNGFISNTVFQVTNEPVKFATCCSKNNLTTGLIEETKAFAVSVLQKDASSGIIGKFGYKSGKEIDKMEGMQIRYGETGVPIVLNESIAYLEFKLVETFDVGTHLLFIGELVQAEILDSKSEPLTYLYYREIKKGVSPKNAPTYMDKSKLEEKTQNTSLKKFQCSVCGYVYDEAPEGKEFTNLPDNWVCPVCDAGKEDFFEIK